jgi:CheY-like chemotaxis protein
MAAILIVEDEAQVRVLAESYLRQQGHQTFTAATMDEAVAILDQSGDIDILLAAERAARAGHSMPHLRFARRRRSLPGCSAANKRAHAQVDHHPYRRMLHPSSMAGDRNWPAVDVGVGALHGAPLRDHQGSIMPMARWSTAACGRAPGAAGLSSAHHEWRANDHRENDHAEETDS